MSKIFILSFVSSEESRDFYFSVPETISKNEFNELIKKSLYQHIFEIANKYLKEENSEYDWILLETILDELMANLIKDLKKYKIELLNVDHKLITSLWAVVEPKKKKIKDIFFK